MEITTIILLMLLGYFAYKYLIQFSPSNKSIKLEDEAYKHFYNVLDKIEKTIDEYEGKINDEKAIIPKLAEDIVKNSRKRLKNIQETESNYLRLKERFKHDSKRLEIYHDWYDYCLALSNIKFAQEALEYDMSDKAYDTFDERVREPNMILEEIEKRFDKHLED